MHVSWFVWTRLFIFNYKGFNRGNLGGKISVVDVDKLRTEEEGSGSTPPDPTSLRYLGLIEQATSTGDDCSIS
jgi:hypothetical protein